MGKSWTDTLKLIRAILDGHESIETFLPETVEIPEAKEGEFYIQHNETLLHFKPAPNCDEIGTDPEAMIAAREQRTIGQKVKELVKDIFSPEPKKVAAETPVKEFFQPEPLQNIAGGGVGELDMSQSYLVCGLEDYMQRRWL